VTCPLCGHPMYVTGTGLVYCPQEWRPRHSPHGLARYVCGCGRGAWQVPALMGHACQMCLRVETR
jgi:hypothetical protein